VYSSLLSALLVAPFQKFRATICCSNHYQKGFFAPWVGGSTHLTPPKSSLYVYFCFVGPPHHSHGKLLVPVRKSVKGGQARGHFFRTPDHSGSLDDLAVVFLGSLQEAVKKPRGEFSNCLPTHLSPSCYLKNLLLESLWSSGLEGFTWFQYQSPRFSPLPE